MQTSGPFTVELPRFDYICQKNDYSGSFGRFRYKVYPLKKDDIETVIVAATYLDRCYELEKEAGNVTEKEFAYSNDGIDEAEAWLVAQYEAFAAQNQ
ncbi:MAG: hypothetical protein IJ133_02685 [Clostridia bacterium]|nr:hypothetical protein [Clostridia bacterium]